MRESYIETKNHWPEVDLPSNLFSYFVSKQLSKNPDDKLFIITRTHFLKLLDEDAFFKDFWDRIQEVYPEESEYFASLIDEQMDYNPAWINSQYYRFLYDDEMYKMTEAERQELQSEFEAIRPSAYEAALKGEAIRLDCDVSEVRPPCHVLPLAPNGDEQLRLIDIPDSIFVNIVNRLDTLDIFRITLVCNKWRSFVYNHHPRALTKAEHAKTTHLITFTDWMDPSKVPCRRSFDESYRKFSWGLIRWCSRITEHLETVILDHEMSYKDAANLIRSCPNLKNFQIGYGNGPFFIGHGPFKYDVMLPNLEFYCFRTIDSYHDPGCKWNLDDDSGEETDLDDDSSDALVDLDDDDDDDNSGYRLDLDTKVLLSCESLCYFGASLVITEIPAIDVRDRMQHAFGRLVALDLREYSIDVLEALADVDHLHLRYLGIVRLAPDCVFDIDTHTAVRIRTLLGSILSKLRTLEILKVDGQPGIGNSTIKLFTELKLNLKTAFFTETLVHSRHYLTDDPDEKDYWEPQVLTDFAGMLVSNDPELDLSEFYFVATGADFPRDLAGMNLGFTVIDYREYYKLATHEVGLNFQSIKRRLGVDF